MSALPGWAENLLQSVWTYVLLAAVFACILIGAVALLLKKPSPRRRSGGGDISSASEIVQEKELTSQILALRDSPRTVLLAAAGLNCMPVTIPIRMAVNLAAEKKKCLLIDLDTKRDAVARVFAIEPKNPPSFEPVATDVENVHVVAAHVFANSNILNIQMIVRATEKKYDVILLNAPYLDGHPDRRQIASCTPYSILFAQTTAQLERLRDVCKSARCKVIGSYRATGSCDEQP